MNPTRRKSCVVFLVFGFMASVSAQNAKPVPLAPDAQLVRVRIGYSGGLCGGFGYCTNLTTVEPFSVISESKDAADKKKLPDRKSKTAITKLEWENLQQAVDTKALLSAPQAVCNAIIDLPCSWIELEFSDKTKISIDYAPSNAPAPVEALLRQVRAIQTRLAVGIFAEDPVPDAATARRRAKQILAPKKWLFPPLQAKLKEGIWTVMGTVVCQETLPRQERYCYGGAGVRIRKSDGKVVEVFPPHN
jgi:hypothetical protein